MFAKFIAAVVRPFRSLVAWAIKPEVEKQMCDAFDSDAFLYRAVGFLVLEKHQQFMFEEITKRLPIGRLAAHVIESDTLDMDEIASRAAKLIQPADVASHVDLDDIAERAAENIDLNDVAEKAAENIDVSAVAENVEKGRAFVKAVAEEISLSDLAGELDYSTLTREMDIDYTEMATNVSYCDLANECIQQIDMEEIASNLNLSEIVGELDMSSLAEEISASDIVSELDYEELAKALIAQFVEANAKAKAVEVRPSAS